MGPAKLSVETDEIEGMPLIRAFGEIDLYTVPEFDQALRTAVERRPHGVIVDLSGVSYLDSAGLSSLLAACRRLTSQNANLYIVAPPGSPGVRRAIEITRLDALMRVHDSLESVLRETRMSRAA